MDDDAVEVAPKSREEKKHKVPDLVDPGFKLEAPDSVTIKGHKVKILPDTGFENPGARDDEKISKPNQVKALSSRFKQG